MQFDCELKRLGTGSWLVRHSGPQVGTVAVTADTREAALDKMRSELRYRLEYCPCSGDVYQDMPIELVLPADESARGDGRVGPR